MKGRLRDLDIGATAFRALNIAILVFLLGPLAIVAVFAVNPLPYISFPPVGLTTRWFEKFFASEAFVNGLLLSLKIAVIVTIISGLLGAAAAIALARGRIPGAKLLISAFLAPLMLPAILTGFAIFQCLITLGIGRPIWALVVGHIIVAVPYVIRTTLAVLSDFDKRIEEAASLFGATPPRVFFEVTLPLIRPGVIAGCIFAFITSFDQFPVSLFLVSPGNETLPIVMFNYMKFDLDGALAAASMVSILISLAVVLTVDRLVGLRATMNL